MLAFLNTLQLKQEILKLLEKLNMKKDFKFEPPIQHGEDGVYVYANEWGYNLTTLERGEIIEHSLTRKLFDILYWSLETTIISEAATLVSKYSKDSDSYEEYLLKMSFYKLELWGRLGINFRKRAEIEVDEIISRNILG